MMTSPSQAAGSAIQVDPGVMGGVPVFAGTRVPIDIVLASLDKGISLERVAAAYPCVTPESVQAARAYKRLKP